ncbi:hypothetical protein [Streptomyces tubbatahanensis]|uniref:hypothetical protein n=1 Tax=Streptomyces tubbatahanensis TaxID=2923272 RepID=UPI00237C65F9|nr:hypothetical protein [Streptomyces tubbatahanensis]
MDVAELVLRYVEAVVWPAVTLVVAWCLRDYLREAFARMTRIETPAGAIEFEAEARQLRERAEEMVRQAPGTPAPGPAPYGGSGATTPSRTPPSPSSSSDPYQQQPPPGNPYEQPPSPAYPSPYGQPLPPGSPYPDPRPPFPRPSPGPGHDGVPQPEPAPGQPAGTAGYGTPPHPRPPLPTASESPVAADFRDSWAIVDVSPVGALAAAWAALSAGLDAALPGLPAARADRGSSALLRQRLGLAGAAPATLAVYEGLRRLRDAAVDDGAPVSTSAARHFLAGCERVLGQVRG